MKAYMVEVEGCGQVKGVYVYDSLKQARVELEDMGFAKVRGKARQYVGWARNAYDVPEHKCYILHTEKEWGVLAHTYYHI